MNNIKGSVNEFFKAVGGKKDISKLIKKPIVNSRGYNTTVYVSPEDVKKEDNRNIIQILVDFFGLKKSTPEEIHKHVHNEYLTYSKTENPVDEKHFQAHYLEYFKHKARWDAKFSGKKSVSGEKGKAAKSESKGGGAGKERQKKDWNNDIMKYFHGLYGEKRSGENPQKDNKIEKSQLEERKEINALKEKRNNMKSGSKKEELAEKIKKMDAEYDKKYPDAGKGGAQIPPSEFKKDRSEMSFDEYKKDIIQSMTEKYSKDFVKTAYLDESGNIKPSYEERLKNEWEKGQKKKGKSEDNFDTMPEVDFSKDPTLRFLTKIAINAMKDKVEGSEVPFNILKREMPEIESYIEKYKSMSDDAKERYKNIYARNLEAKKIYDKVKNKFEGDSSSLSKKETSEKKTIDYNNPNSLTDVQIFNHIKDVSKMPMKQLDKNADLVSHQLNMAEKQGKSERIIKKLEFMGAVYRVASLYKNDKKMSKEDIISLVDTGADLNRKNSDEKKEKAKWAEGKNSFGDKQWKLGDTGLSIVLTDRKNKPYRVMYNGSAIADETNFKDAKAQAEYELKDIERSQRTEKMATNAKDEYQNALNHIEKFEDDAGKDRFTDAEWNKYLKETKKSINVFSKKFRDDFNKYLQYKDNIDNLKAAAKDEALDESGQGKLFEKSSDPVYGTILRTNGGRVLLKTFGKRDISKLSKKQITDKNGKKMTVYVSNGEAAGNTQAAKSDPASDGLNPKPGSKQDVPAGKKRKNNKENGKKDPEKEPDNNKIPDDEKRIEQQKEEKRKTLKESIKNAMRSFIDAITSTQAGNMADKEMVSDTADEAGGGMKKYHEQDKKLKLEQEALKKKKLEREKQKSSK